MQTEISDKEKRVLKPVVAVIILPILVALAVAIAELGAWLVGLAETWLGLSTATALRIVAGMMAFCVWLTFPAKWYEESDKQ